MCEWLGGWVVGVVWVVGVRVVSGWVVGVSSAPLKVSTTAVFFALCLPGAVWRGQWVTSGEWSGVEWRGVCAGTKRAHASYGQGMWCLHVVSTCGVYLGCLHGVSTWGDYMGCLHGVSTWGVYMG